MKLVVGGSVINGAYPSSFAIGGVSVRRVCFQRGYPSSALGEQTFAPNKNFKTLQGLECPKPVKPSLFYISLCFLLPFRL